MSTNHFRDAVAAYFKAHEGQWIDGDTFREIGGKYAYRTRISECRTQLGMRVDNRVRRLPSGARVSEYRYLKPGQADLLAEAGQVAACGSEAA